MNITLWLYDIVHAHIITWLVRVVSSLYQVYKVQRSCQSVLTQAKSIKHYNVHDLHCHAAQTGLSFNRIMHYLFPCQHKIKYHSFLLYSTTSTCWWCWWRIFLQNMWQFVICSCKNTSTAISKIYTVLCCRLSCIQWQPHDKMVAGCIFII